MNTVMSVSRHHIHRVSRYLWVHLTHLSLVLSRLGLLLLDSLSHSEILAGLPLNLTATGVGQSGGFLVQQIGTHFVGLSERLEGINT